MSGPAEDWITEAELHSHLEGELDAERCAAVEAFLARQPELAARARSYRRHMTLIRRAYGPLLERPVPPEMVATATVPAARSRIGWHHVAAAAAASVFLLAGGIGAGWWVRDRATTIARQEPGFVADAFSAHQVYAVEVRHPVEVGADQTDHLAAWLSRRLGFALTIPHLSGQGFELVGGRLLPSTIGPAAQLMYQDANGRRLTCYVRPSADPEEAAFRFARDGELSALYWRDRGQAWALLGELPRDELLRLAHIVYRALEP
jgi:anti-sigma factor RsiW